MADLSDVETALTDAIAGALYPQGAGAASMLGTVVRVYRGWPAAAALEADLAGGIVNVSVFPEPGHQRNTTRWRDEVDFLAAVTPTLGIAVSGMDVTLSGSADLGQLVGILADRQAVVHRTAAGDTPAGVAAVLAAQLRTQRIALVSGTTVTVPGAALLVGRVFADQPALWLTRRQEQRFRISFWCPDPATRDAVTAAVDAALSTRIWLALADATSGRLRYAGTTVFDQSQDAGLYRRDLVYNVEYATTLAENLPRMMFGDFRIDPNGAGVVAEKFS
jgi:hypothetical protein